MEYGRGGSPGVEPHEDDAPGRQQAWPQIEEPRYTRASGDSSAFKAKRWQEAERQFRAVVDRFGQSDGAAEALYWAGVSRYKASGDASALKETAAAFGSRYRESPWAKKASIWKG